MGRPPEGRNQIIYPIFAVMSRNISDIIIIGGGAAGLISAIYAKTQTNKVTILERRAYNAARARAGAEAADPNNNISEEQRRSLQDFANRGRRSTEAKNVITEADRKTAREARETLDGIIETRRNKPKSGGR